MSKEKYHARLCSVSHRWIVETELPCINGLSAWVAIANCGDPNDERNQMCDLDPEAWAESIATALNKFMEPSS